MKRSIVWFRNDLRVHDNEALHDALTHSDEIIPVYVLDDRIFRGNTAFGFDKTGVHRLRFVLESLYDLRKSLEDMGTTLIIRSGITEDVITDIAREYKTSWVYCNRERTDEEVKVQDVLENRLWEIGQEMRYYRGKMLYYTADLPFPISHTPDQFTAFRKEVEKYVPVRKPIEMDGLKAQPLSINIDKGHIPTLRDFGHDEPDKVMDHLRGGESIALQELQYYIWDSDLVATYKKTRNGLLGRDFSSKLSTWLSVGCLSPKTVYAEVKKYEKERKKNDSTYWLVFELLWRDFFRLMGKKHGNKIFHRLGTHGDDPSIVGGKDMKLFRVWAEGRTGIPFIDANMRELNATGFMSNRGRQNVASFLTKDLKLDWRMGAEYFESMLIDYDPCSNYGNWNYVAGVGVDPRAGRYFNILFQAKRYDQNGKYVKNWLPELRALPADLVHTPDRLRSDQQQKFGIQLGKDYPQAVVSSKKWD